MKNDISALEFIGWMLLIINVSACAYIVIDHLKELRRAKKEQQDRKENG